MDIFSGCPCGDTWEGQRLHKDRGHSILSVLHTVQRNVQHPVQRVFVHVVVSWFLNNTKAEMSKPLERRQHTLVINSDFAQNITVDRKYELADQYFHKPEILVFGGVASVVLPPAHSPTAPTRALHLSSHIVSSDYRYLKHGHQ